MKECSSERPRLLGDFTPRVFGVVLAAAVSGALILASFNNETTGLRQLLTYFLFTFTYSCCIGFPSAAVLRLLGLKAAANRRGWTVAPRVLVLLATNTVGCLAAGVILSLLGQQPWNRYWDEFRFSVLFGTAITLTFGLGMSFYETARFKLQEATLALRTREMEDERARKLLVEARLSSLESRIHPHFLFNTLNSIAALIPKDPKRAEDMVGKLASLLRFSLNANQARLVPLGQEMGIVRDYLEIERARFGARLRYSIEVPPELETAQVPPLAVATLVENSVKHVIAERPEGGEIVVSAAAGPGRLWLRVGDSGPGFALADAPPGRGLDNLSARLGLLFGPDARLETERSGARAVVRISLPV